jgi:hypothetical protein
MAQGSVTVMQKINKTTSAPIAAAFFVLSLAIMPFSLKVVGFTLSLNPSMSAVVDVWNQIAWSFGSKNQPSSATELLAINMLTSDEAPDASSETASESSSLANLKEPEANPAYQLALSSAEVEGAEVEDAKAERFVASAPQPMRLKSKPHSVKRVAAESYYLAIQDRIGRQSEALRAAEAAQRELASRGELLKSIDKQLVAMKLDFRLPRAVSFNKDMKVFMRSKPVRSAPAPRLTVPRLTACDLRTALTGGKQAETRQREARVRVIETPALSFENCEL